MAIASIHFQKAKAHSAFHNFREDEPSYLLPKKFRLENEYYKSEISEKKLFENELLKAKRKGGRIPKFENSRWEAVINLNKNHSLEDVKNVADFVCEKFNIISSDISIHKDEGHIENGIVHHNFHAHINFVTYKDGKQNWRKEHIKNHHLSQLQTEIADILKMEKPKRRVFSKEERYTKAYNIAIKSSTLADFKAIYLAEFEKKEETKARLSAADFRKSKRVESELLAKQKDLKALVAKLRAELKEKGAARAEYASLEQLTKDLKERIKAKDLTEQELKDILDFREVTKSLDDVVVNLKKEIKSLKSSATKATNKEVSEIEELKETHAIELLAKEAEFQTQNKELIEAQETIETQNTTISTQKEEYEDLEQDINELKTQLKSKIDLFNSLNGANLEIEKDLVAMEDKYHELDKGIQELSKYQEIDVEKIVNNCTRTKSYEVKDGLFGTKTIKYTDIDINVLSSELYDIRREEGKTFDEIQKNSFIEALANLGRHQKIKNTIEVETKKEIETNNYFEENSNTQTEKSSSSKRRRRSR